MASSKVLNAITVVEETFVGMNEGAEIAGLSAVYFRKNIEKLEKERGELKRLIFGKQVIETSVAEEIKELVAHAKAERSLKAAEKAAKKSTQRVDAGPTLLDLKYHAKRAGLKIGRLNKNGLVALLEKNDVAIEGFEVEVDDESQE